MNLMTFLFRPHFHGHIGWVVGVLVLVLVVILILQNRK